MDSIQKSAEAEFESRVQRYKKNNGTDYRTAFYAVKAASPELYRKYYLGADAPVKMYGADTLTAAQREMALLVADSGKTQVLAGWAVDRLAKRQLENAGAGIADPRAEYKNALAIVRRENPTLARAESDGFIDSKDFALLALLIPAVAGEVERANFSRRDGQQVVKRYDDAGNEYRCY